MGDAMSASKFEVPEWESVELLESETVGRMCIVVSDYPIAFPISYRLVRDDTKVRIVFRAAPHAALAQYDGPASMEVDRVDPDHLNSWSVIVRGTLHKVFGNHELPDTFPLLEGRYQWMVLEVSAVSGRRFVSAPAFDGRGVDWRPAD